MAFISTLKVFSWVLKFEKWILHVWNVKVFILFSGWSKTCLLCVFVCSALEEDFSSNYESWSKTLSKWDILAPPRIWDWGSLVTAKAHCCPPLVAVSTFFPLPLAFPRWFLFIFLSFLFLQLFYYLVIIRRQNWSHNENSFNPAALRWHFPETQDTADHI